MLAFFEAARANLVAARIARQDLTVAFAAIGVDYMELHPVIHRAIRKEAMVRGAEAAAAQFVSFAIALDEGDGTHDEKANILRDIYRVRADGPYTPRQSAWAERPSPNNIDGADGRLELTDARSREG